MFHRSFPQIFFASVAKWLMIMHIPLVGDKVEGWGGVCGDKCQADHGKIGKNAVRMLSMVHFIKQFALFIFFYKVQYFLKQRHVP